MVDESNRLFRVLAVMLLLIAFAMLLFPKTISAKVGTTGTEYNSKGTITDEAGINIDSTDVYTLDEAIEANNRTLENYSSIAGDIYNNLSAIDSAIARAKTEIAQNLEDMNIYVSRNDAGAINSHAGTTDWVGTTMAAKSVAVANYTLEELIGQMKTSVTGSGSEMTAKINAGDFKSKKATSSISSGMQTVNLSGMTEINLDKNQQVVLPSGYYGNGMTINNVISGETLNWNPDGPATKVIDRPYTSGTISTERAYNAGYDKGKGEGAKVSGGLTMNGWGRDGDDPGVTECHVYPGKYKIDCVFMTFSKYVPGYRLYLNGTLVKRWEASPDEANKHGEKYSSELTVPYEGTLRCEAWSSPNTGMVFLYGAIYRE